MISKSLGILIRIFLKKSKEFSTEIFTWESSKTTFLLNNNCKKIYVAVCLPNGTIAVACCDGTIRLFTDHEKLMASASEQEEFEQELSKFAIPIKSDEVMSQIDRSKLPGVEALTQAGAKDGQTLMVNTGSEIEVHQWSAADKKWVKIGVAVGSSTGAGGSGTRQKSSYLGKVNSFLLQMEQNIELIFHNTFTL